MENARNEKSKNEYPVLLTIRQCAAEGILNEHALRQLRVQGRLPGVQLPSRFLINKQALIDRINNNTL